MTIFIQFIFSMLSTIAFGIISNVPRRALLACGFTGAFGWMAFWFCQDQSHQSIGISSFFGALIVGLLSIFFSKKIHMPVIVFNIPGLIPLVPGGPAYMGVREMVRQNFNQAMQYFVVVLVTAGAIAIGFMFTNLIERALKHTKANFFQKK